MKFKPEDFSYFCGYQADKAASASELANAKLKEWLDQAPVVYGVKDDETGWVFGRRAKHDTHKALVICIEEMPKQECMHEPCAMGTMINGRIVKGVETKCKHCNVELIAEWKEKK